MEKTKTSTAQKEASMRYAAKALKRVPLDLPVEAYGRLKAAAETAGLSVNGYIKTAIAAQMDADAMESVVDAARGAGVTVAEYVQSLTGDGITSGGST